MNVFFLVRYGNLGASSRYRFYQYADTLRSAGITPLFFPLFDNAVLAGRYQRGRKSKSQNIFASLKRAWQCSTLRSASLIVLEGEALPYAPPVFEYLFNIRSIPYVVDFDDAIFHYYDKSKNWFVRRLLGNKITKVVRRSSCVIAGNQYLYNYAHAANARRIEIIPTVVDLSRYPFSAPISSSRTEMRIGWIGSPGSSRYLQTVKDPLAVAIRDDDCRIILVGAGTDHGLDALNPELKPWTEETEFNEICNFDVGIMPLPDDDWAKGKCGFKLIQYLAAGKPVIASPVGANCEIVRHGLNGFLASSANEWAECIRKLKNNPDLARRMGENGRKLIEERYSLQAMGSRMVDVLRSSAVYSK